MKLIAKSIVTTIPFVDINAIYDPETNQTLDFTMNKKGEVIYDLKTKKQYFMIKHHRIGDDETIKIVLFTIDRGGRVHIKAKRTAKSYKELPEPAKDVVNGILHNQYDRIDTISMFLYLLHEA